MVPSGGREGPGGIRFQRQTEIPRLLQYFSQDEKPSYSCSTEEKVLLALFSKFFCFCILQCTTYIINGIRIARFCSQPRHVGAADYEVRG